MIKRLLRTLASRLEQEDGIAMMVAIIALFITITLAAAAVAVSVHTNTTTRRDSNEKNALEAAEAGLQVATYRLNMLNPGALLCVGDTVPSSPPASGYCQSSTYTLGNGSSYQYYTTPVVSTGHTCVGENIDNTQFGVNDVASRCVTAVGTANGVTARSQIRIAQFTAIPLFPNHGVTGLSSVTLTGGAAVVGSAASNGNVSENGGTSSTGIVLGPGATFTANGNASGGPITKQTTPIVLSPVDPGTSNQTSLAACPSRQTAGFPSCNDDYRITNGIATAQHPLTPTTPYDQAAGNISYNATTRVLSLSGTASLTLGGGLYNFCEIDASGQSTITLAATTQAEVFIDSPDDPGSGCASGTGNFSMTGGASWINPSGNPLNLQLYVYGLKNFKSTVTYSGNAAFIGTIYAPQSVVSLSGNGTVTGAIAGRQVTLNGNAFNFDNRDTTLQATATGLYYRTAWAQCTSSYTASAPFDGCG